MTGKISVRGDNIRPAGSLSHTIKIRVANQRPRQKMNVEMEKKMSNETASMTGVTLTDVAATKVGSLLAQEGRDDLVLRIAVQPGGCSGLRYQLYFDDRVEDSDSVASFGSVKVVTDKMSAPYLMGASIDYVDTIEKQGFTIDNPNAQGSCACGDSFN